MPDLEEAVVEDIVRWYVMNGGRSGSERWMPKFGLGEVTLYPWGVRDQIGVVLAEAKPRVPAGHPYDDTATITAVERAVIAEVAYNEAVRWASQLQAHPTIVLDVRWELDNAMADANVWYAMMRRFRAHPTWSDAMGWLRHAFGLIADQDKSFLAHLTT